MLTKALCSLLVVLTGTALCAAAPGDMKVYPFIGGGMSFTSGDYWTGPALGNYTAGDPTLYSDPEEKTTGAFSIGATFDYFLSESLAFTTGLSYDYIQFIVVYPRNTASSDMEMTMDFAFITIPAGVRYYIDDFVLIGGGFYYGNIINDDAKLKSGSNTVDVELKTLNDLGFFIDLGLNFNVSDTGTLLLYARYKCGLTNVYDEQDIVTNIKVRSLVFNVGYGIQI